MSNSKAKIPRNEAKSTMTTTSSRSGMVGARSRAHTGQCVALKMRVYKIRSFLASASLYRGLRVIPPSL
uniref:Uncharacterized protein n=1 Tax=Trichogramma kaykai TaxID=54128 RepID=A0ABD2XE94_9HYME